MQTEENSKNTEKQAEYDDIRKILGEAEKVIKGKRRILEKVLMAILAQGNILLEDVPGVGKTTLALTFSKVLGLDYKRIQFTPDVMPSDITGFTMFDKASGTFKYKEGVATQCNLLLADEINRTASKTQSALLEVMEEKQVTVDGKTYQLKTPFTVIATQNPSGTAGTQILPQAQLDRFMVRLSMGYPDVNMQVEILKDRQKENPIEQIRTIVSQKEVLVMQEKTAEVFTSDEILLYMSRLAEASRNEPLLSMGISPRGVLALLRMAKASAFVNGRDYVVPSDVKDVFIDICAHRVVVSAKGQIREKTADEILAELLLRVAPEQLDTADRLGKKEKR